MNASAVPVMPALACPDCGGKMYLRAKPSTWKGGNPWVYLCEHRAGGCGGLMSAHPDGTPQGIPAPAELRQARRVTHGVFDRLWLDAPSLYYVIEEQDERGRERAIANIRRAARKRAYAWLADHLGLTADECHIGKLDIATLRLIWWAARQMTAADIRQWWKATQEAGQ